ncbi:transposase [Dubosiella newyorkensis]|uniref:transposase n=1 Tax=Dubosiella newyorkensis TaxID=1862672 RepID=UPI0023F0B350|nr:transposase [Dubosiella newyorkensis]
MVMIDLDTLVPGDHLVRKLQKAIDWKRIQELALPLYSHLGRSGISPVVLFKLLMINFIFGHNSMRAACRECEVNMAYRWFLGINPSATIPNYSTWSQNYSRRYRGTGIKNGFVLCVHTEPAICREIRHIIETKEIYKKRKCRKNLCRYERKQQA